MSRIDAREKAMQLLYQLASQEGQPEEQISLFLAQRTPLKETRDEDPSRQNSDFAAAEDGINPGDPSSSSEDEEETEVDEAGKAAYTPLTQADRDYLLNLVHGVMEHEQELDAIYGPYLVKWTPERLPTLERMLLRLGTYEIVYSEDIPDSVAINEVVRLTRKYADEDAYSYINAVLGKVSRRASSEAETEALHEE